MRLKVLAYWATLLLAATVGDGSPSDTNIKFVGRWDTSNVTAYVPNWAGAYFRATFTGTTVKLKQLNKIDFYYRIDGGAYGYLTNVSGTVNLTPTLLPAGNHTLLVSYRVVGGSYTGDAVFQLRFVHPNDAGHRAIAARLAPIIAAKF